MFDYSKLSNAVGSLSGFGMKCTFEIGWVDSTSIRLRFHLLSSSKNCPFLAWSCSLGYQSYHS